MRAKWGVIAVLLGLTASAQARPVVCPPADEATAITFAILTPKPAYTYVKSVNEITERARGVHIATATNSRVLGLTVAQPRFSIGGRSIGVRYADGYCVRISEVEAQFGYERLDIFVGREYFTQNCAFNAVVEHENEHAAVHIKALTSYAPLARAALERGVKEMTPRYTRDAKRTGQEMIEELQAQMMPSLWEFENFYKARNGAIDTPESYTSVFKKCDDWIRVP